MGCDPPAEKNCSILFSVGDKICMQSNRVVKLLPYINSTIVCGKSIEK